MDKVQNKEISNKIPSPKTFREGLHLKYIKAPSHFYKLETWAVRSWPCTAGVKNVWSFTSISTCVFT